MADTFFERTVGRVFTRIAEAIRDRRGGPSPEARNAEERARAAGILYGGEPTIWSQLIYIVVGLLSILAIVAIVLTQSGFVAKPVEETREPWDLSIIFIAFFTVLVMGVTTGRRLPDLVHRLRQLRDRHARNELIVLFTSVPLAGALVVWSMLMWWGTVPAWEDSRLGLMVPVLTATVGILLAFGPYGIYVHVRERQEAAIEGRFPDFLRDLNESYRAGLTMPQALRAAGRGDYGRLSGEIRRMVHQVSWGEPFTEALQRFAERVDTPTVKRSVALIVKAIKAGGNVEDVLGAAAKDAREVKILEKERAGHLGLYVVVIYVAMGVFLAVTAAMQTMLIPSILNAASGTGGNIGGVGVSTRLTVQDFRFIFYAIGLVQALGSGMVAGVMAEASLPAGLKHSAILVALTCLTLGVLV